MQLNKLKPSWQAFKWSHEHPDFDEEEVLRLIATTGVSKGRSLAVNLVMLITLLLVCY